MRLHPVLVVVLGAVACGLGPRSEGKCRPRMIAARGQVVCERQATVVVTTSPVLGGLGGATSAGIPVREGRFDGRVRFDAYQYGACEPSCAREPKSVTASLVVSDKVVDAVRLDVRQDFERNQDDDYNLKKDVVLRCKK